MAHGLVGCLSAQYREPSAISHTLSAIEAERVGFEPTVPFGTRALQARALDQTTQPLQVYYGADYTMRKG